MLVLAETLAISTDSVISIGLVVTIVTALLLAQRRFHKLETRVAVIEAAARNGGQAAATGVHPKVDP